MIKAKLRPTFGCSLRSSKICLNKLSPVAGLDNFLSFYLGCSLKDSAVLKAHSTGIVLVITSDYSLEI